MQHRNSDIVVGAMNPLKKAASLLKGKSVKQVQIDSDSESEADSKSSTPVAVDSKKKNLFTSPVKSPTKSASSSAILSPDSKPANSLDDRLLQARRPSVLASNRPQSSIPTPSDIPKTPTKTNSDRSINDAPPTLVTMTSPPPPPPSQSQPVEDLTHRYQQQITRLEDEVTQLKAEKRNLEKSLEESQRSISILKEANHQTIQSLERKIEELMKEEEEMRTELFSKYDELHALGESKDRLHSQYLEVAKQLKAFEDEALNKAKAPPPPVPIVVTSASVPAPVPASAAGTQRNEEISDLRHQLKELEEKIKTQKSLTESKQLMNMKLDARNRELIQQLDQMKSHLNKIQHEGHEKDSIIEKLKTELLDYKEKYDGPHNIDKRRIEQLVAEIEKLNESLQESEQNLIKQEENHQKKFFDTNTEIEFLRKLVSQYEAEIASLEKMLEEESSEMTQLLIRMKGNNEGLYRFLQAIFRRYNEYEKLIEESIKVQESPRDHAAEEKESGSQGAPEKPVPNVTPPQPILDLQDLIFLLDSHIMTLKVKAGHRPLHQMLSHLAKSSNDSPSQGASLSPRVDRSAVDKPSRPPPLSAGGKVNQEYTIRLLEFMDKYQISEIEKYFKNLKSSSPEDANPPQSPTQVSDNRPPKLGSSSKKSSSKKPPVMNTPHPDDASLASCSTQSTTSTRTKGSEYVCFTINRGDGRPDEKWLEIVDSHTSLKYYFNPQTGVTQWELPIHVKEK